MVAMSCSFEAIPRSIVSEGSVRFFPVVTDNTREIVSWDWDFGDGTSHGTDSTPIHAYPSVAALTTYDVALTVTDANGATATLTRTEFITSDTVAHIPTRATDGSAGKIAVLIYDDTNMMMIKRTPYLGNLYLLNPIIGNSLDKISTTTFQILDIGTSTSIERDLIVKGKSVLIAIGKEIVFSGKIRRATNNTTNGFDSSNRVKLWDIECDSGYGGLRKLNISAASLDPDGKIVVDSPGYIARRILAPGALENDIRGVINTVDARIGYQLNTVNDVEQVGARYDHMEDIRQLTNYDLRSRPDAYYIPYHSLHEYLTGTKGRFYTWPSSFSTASVFYKSVAFIYAEPEATPAGWVTQFILNKDTGSVSVTAMANRGTIQRLGAGTDAGKFYVSDDDGELYFYTYQGTVDAGHRIYSIVFVSGNTWLAGSDDGKIWKSTNDGVIWSLVKSTAGAAVTDLVSFSSTVFIAAVSGSGIWRTADAGATWTLITALDGGTTTIILAKISSTSAIAGTNDQKVYITVDSGASFGASISVTAGSGNVDKLLVLSNATILAAVTLTGGTATQYIYSSTNTGATWSELSHIVEPGATGAATAFYQHTTGDVLLCCTNGAGSSIYRSVDLGENFTREDDNKTVYAFVCRQITFPVTINWLEAGGIGLHATVYYYDLPETSSLPAQIAGYMRVYNNGTGWVTGYAPYIYDESYGNVPGTLMIYKGEKIDFAPDLTQPSSVGTWNVNEDIFNFNDNDDEKKLATKVVTRGKDLFGKTISVSLAAVHEYDNVTQFPKNSTYLTKKVEGYIYKNTTVPFIKSVTVHAALTSTAFTTNLVTDNKALYFPGAVPATWHVGFPVKVLATTGTLPDPLVAGTQYYVTAIGANYIYVSGSSGGTSITLTSEAVATVYIEFIGAIQVDNSDAALAQDAAVVFAGTSFTGITFGDTYYIVTPTSTSATWYFQVSATVGGSAIGIGAGSGVSVFPKTTETPGISLYGWGYTFPAGAGVNLVTPFGTAYPRVVSSSTEIIDTNGQQLTFVVTTAPLVGDFSNRGYLVANRLYVHDTASVGTNEVLIGEEKITITAVGTDTTYGPYIDVDGAIRISSTTLKAYPHGIGAMVARTNYTEASPQALSPVAEHGILIDDRTADSNITYGDLDTYATQFLVGTSSFFKKAVTWGPSTTATVARVGETYAAINQRSLTGVPRVGDRLLIVNSTGATPEDWQIVGVTIKPDEGRTSLELGDFEKNTFTSLTRSTAGLNFTIT
ncbi:hypothetical protein CCP3SC15_420013 [Gammaproteobacteria bacterium]